MNVGRAARMPTVELANLRDARGSARKAAQVATGRHVRRLQPAPGEIARLLSFASVWAADLRQPEQILSRLVTSYRAWRAQPDASSRAARLWRSLPHRTLAQAAQQLSPYPISGASVCTDVRVPERIGNARAFSASPVTPFVARSSDMFRSSHAHPLQMAVECARHRASMQNHLRARAPGSPSATRRRGPSQGVPSCTPFELNVVALHR